MDRKNCSACYSDFDRFSLVKHKFAGIQKLKLQSESFRKNDVTENARVDNVMNKIQGTG